MNDAFGWLFIMMGEMMISSDREGVGMVFVESETVRGAYPCPSPRSSPILTCALHV